MTSRLHIAPQCHASSVHMRDSNTLIIFKCVIKTVLVRRKHGSVSFEKRFFKLKHLIKQMLIFIDIRVACLHTPSPMLLRCAFDNGKFSFHYSSRFLQLIFRNFHSCVKSCDPSFLIIISVRTTNLKAV